MLQKRMTHGWGARKLQPLLETEGVKVSERTINRILKRLGAMRREDCHRPALSRFERERPNELWQMDFKGEYVLRGGKNCYPLSMIDDHRRFPVGLYGLPGTSSPRGPGLCDPNLSGVRSTGGDADGSWGALVGIGEPIGINTLECGSDGARDPAVLQRGGPPPNHKARWNGFIAHSRKGSVTVEGHLSSLPSGDRC